MRVFVTGATGFVGTAVVQELLGAGHQVLGLVRSDASAEALAAAGGEGLRGDLEDLDSLRRGVEQADGVIHTGFIHDFSRFEVVCAVDKRAIETMGEVLVGSDRPFIVTSGTALLSPGHLATEVIVPSMATHPMPRVATEVAAAELAARGVHASMLRLSPSTHGDGDHGFVPILINIAREKGVSAYVGEGLNRWSAVHRFDAARLYLLALEKNAPNTRYHAVAEEGILFRDIAEVIGKRLNLPVVSKTPDEAAAHFGWFAHFAAIDCPASSALTQAELGWSPKERGLLSDLEGGRYF
jgi:nucleoside-diphosphate-sugar epimerase